MTPEPSRLPRAAGVPDRVPLNVLFGLPDDQKATIIVQGDGKALSYDLVGTVGILPHLSVERFNTFVVYLDSARERPLTLGPGALLNHIAEPDICSGALQLARQIAGSVDRPCFNHPAAVMRTTRDDVSRLLAGIPGLRVPQTIRVRERNPAKVRDVIAAAGLAYPVLARVAGSHLGTTLIRIDTPDELYAIRDLIRDDRSSLYATEFCDFISPDNRYRKFRVVVVGEEIFLRHCIIAENWMIHRNDRAANTEAQESAAFAIFDSDLKGRLQSVFREIGSRLGLDYFGVDCNIDETGRVLLFEANACMNILTNTSPSPNIWDEPVARIKNALEQHLASPTRWRHFNGRSV